MNAYVAMLDQLKSLRALLVSEGATGSAHYLATDDLIKRVEKIFEGAPTLHCATCQCARIHGEKPVPDNPRSKSWHDGSPAE